MTVAKRESGGLLRSTVSRPGNFFGWTRRDIPDFAGVLRDSPIARKLSRTRNVDDGRPRPCLRIAVIIGRAGRERRCRNVSRRGGDRRSPFARSTSRIGSKTPGSPGLKWPAGDQIQSRSDFRVVLVVPIRAVPAACVAHLVSRQAEQEHVLLAGLFSHFDGGSVTRADGQSAIHHELHVAGAAGFVTGGRDLFGNVARRNQPLGHRDAVVGQKNDLQSSFR